MSSDNKRTYEEQRARYKRVLDAKPLPATDKAQLFATVPYMSDRLRGIPCRLLPNGARSEGPGFLLS
jgi:hypothetical protein